MARNILVEVTYNTSKGPMTKRLPSGDQYILDEKNNLIVKDGSRDVAVFASGTWTFITIEE